MRVGRLVLVGELDVVEFGAAERRLLLLDRELVPADQVVGVLLDQQVAAAGVGRVVVLGDHHRVLGVAALGVLGAVDEAEQVALVEGAEAVHLVDDADALVEAVGDQPRQLEAEVEATGADVEEEVAGGRGRGVHRAAQFLERMEFGRQRRVEEALPEGRPDADHAAEPGVRRAEADRAAQAAEVRQQVEDLFLAARVDADRQEDRRVGERREDRLGLFGHRYFYRDGRRFCGARPGGWCTGSGGGSTGGGGPNSRPSSPSSTSSPK